MHNFLFNTQSSADSHVTRPDDVKADRMLDECTLYSDDSMANDGEHTYSGSERGSSEDHISSNSNATSADKTSGTKSKQAATRRRRRSLASRNLDEGELQILRQKINGRERQRMHDLNSALDGLREVIQLRHILLRYNDE